MPENTETAPEKLEQNPEPTSTAATEAPTETPAPEEPASTFGKEDPLLQSIFADLGMETEIKPAPEPAKEPPVENKGEETQPSEPEVPAETEKPKAKKRIVEAETFEDPEPEATPAPQPKPVEPAKPTTGPDDEYVAGLTEEQKDELAEAEVAERLFPDKYKGRRKQLIEWYKKYDTEAQKLVADDPRRTLDEGDEDYARLLRTKPKIDRLDYKRVQRTIGEESAVQRVKKEIDPSIERLERQQREIKLEPELKSVQEAFEKGVATLLGMDKEPQFAELAKAISEDVKKAEEDYGMEVDVFKQEVANTKSLVKEYVRFVRKVVDYSPENTALNTVAEFITKQGDAFKANGGKLLMRRDGDGVTRRFLTRAEYAAVARNNPAELQKYWTFSDQDVVELLAMQTKMNIQSRIKAEEDRIKRYGFERRPKKASAEPQNKTEQSTPLSPPKAKPSPSPGAAPSKPKQADPGPGINVVETLKLNEL